MKWFHILIKSICVFVNHLKSFCSPIFHFDFSASSNNHCLDNVILSHIRKFQSFSENLEPPLTCYHGIHFEDSWFIPTAAVCVDSNCINSIILDFSMMPIIKNFHVWCFQFVHDALDPCFSPAGGSVDLHSCEKAEFRLEQLGLGRWRQLVQREGRPGSELCWRGWLGKRLGWGGHGHNAEQQHPPPARRGSAG